MPRNKGIYKLFRTKEQFEAFKSEHAHFNRVFMMDFVTLALGRMGFGEKRLKRFDKILDDVVVEYMEEFGQDLADDKELIYSRAKMEQELQQHCGKFYAPPEVRYGI